MQDITVDLITELYREYAGPLRDARESQRALLSARPPIKAQLDDIEAEITYLLLRAFRPTNVVEIGALHGWSTTWILHALRDNDVGTLCSYDRVDHALRRVPAALSRGRWSLVCDDVRAHGRKVTSGADYVFLDAAHSARFARWYCAALLPDLPPGTPVSTHDVFHRRTPLPRTEGAALLEWLSFRGISYFTASPAKDPQAYHSIMETKERLGLAAPVRAGNHNPMLFFAVS